MNAPSSDASKAPHAASVVPDAPPLPSQVMSFGTFKPVGHVLIAIAGSSPALALEHALAAQGFVSGLVWITPKESAEELQALIDEASPLAGFGYEITLMRRYVELSHGGSRFLLVPVSGDEMAEKIGDIARAAGAVLAVRYGYFTVEELI